MLVRDVMHPEVVTIAATASLGEAYRLLQSRSIRHLPVVREGALVGVVTDRDLRLATSELAPEPFPTGAAVADVMTPDPRTATPLDPIEEAARTMRSNRIGCLPVLDGDALVGIVTVTDLLDALLRLTGVGKPGGRLALRLEDTPGRLAELMGLLAREGINAHSVLTYEADGTQVEVLLRVNTLGTHALAERLRTAGFGVTWPPEAPWSR